MEATNRDGELINWHTYTHALTHA